MQGAGPVGNLGRLRSHGPARPRARRERERGARRAPCPGQRARRGRDPRGAPRPLRRVVVRVAFRDVPGRRRAPAAQMTTAPALEPMRAAEARLRRYRWRLVTPGADGLGSWRHRARGLGLVHSIALELDGHWWE